MTGNISRVAVTLTGLSALRPQDLDFLLVSPTGAKFIFLADGQAGLIPVEDAVYTFADDAPSAFPVFGYGFSGSYKPTSGDSNADTFPAPAPPGPYNQPPAASFASVFNGSSPNGTWSLYMVDDAIGGTGSLNSGWKLTITTDGAPATFTNTEQIGINEAYTAASPYGSGINVAGLSGVISKVRVTLNGFSHVSPSEVDVLLVTPDGRGMVIMSDAGANQSVSNVNLTFDDSSFTFLTPPLTTGTYRPTDLAGTADFFAVPAPFGPYIANSNLLNNLNGFSPNGEWRLYVVDTGANNTGSIAGGWTLDITTQPASPPAAGGCAAPGFTRGRYDTGGVNPTNVAIADLNNDSKPDLAVTNQVSNDVTVMIGNGDGTFSPRPSIAVGGSPYAIAAGRFNGDANMDLVTVLSASNSVAVSLGNGDGSFATPTYFNVGPNPISIAVGDFNNDLNQDIAVANFGGFFSGSVSIRLGNGNGGFTPGTNLLTRSQPSFVVAAKLNADDFIDLVVTSFGSDSVSTFFGNGTGTFQLQQIIGTGSGPVAIEIADLSGDGIADLSVANYNDDGLTYCTGIGPGSFINCARNNPIAGSNPVSLAAADYEAKGVASLATALIGSNMIKVDTTDIPVGLNPNAVETADINGDGKPDLITVNSGSNDISVLINSCIASHGNIFDINGDGFTDHAVFRPSRAVWYDSEAGNLQRPMGRPTDVIVPADYDGDLRTDLGIYRPDSGLWYTVSAAPALRTIHFLQFGTAGDIAVPADYDGDGKADLAVWRPSEGNWYIRPSHDNSFSAFNFGTLGDKPVAADYDGDGKADLAVYRPSSGIWFILKSSDGQTIITQFGASEDKTVAADYDGDAKADIAVWRPSNGAWYVLRSSDGGFQAGNWGLSTDVPAPGDYDGDGKIDFAVFRPSDSYWYVLRSSGAGPAYFQWGLAGDRPLPNAFVR
jgi:subtilisin-like proprotein convertase family protein